MRGWISVVERQRQSCAPSCFLEGLRRRSAPPVYVVENMRRANEGDGRDKARVQFYGALPELPRLAVAFLRLQIPKLATAQKQVIGFKIVGVLGQEPLPVVLTEIERERGDNLLGNVVLDGEDVRKVSVKALGPEMPACLGVNQLRRNAHPVARFADASLKDVADAQVLADVAYIDIPALEGEAGVARDHEQL